MADLGLSTYVLVNQWSEKCSLNHCHIIFCPDKMIKNTKSIKYSSEYKDCYIGNEN